MIQYSVPEREPSRKKQSRKSFGLMGGGSICYSCDEAAGPLLLRIYCKERRYPCYFEDFIRNLPSFFLEERGGGVGRRKK